MKVSNECGDFSKDIKVIRMQILKGPWNIDELCASSS